MTLAIQHSKWQLISPVSPPVSFYGPKNEHGWWVRHSHSSDTVNYSLVFTIALVFSLTLMSLSAQKFTLFCCLSFHILSNTPPHTHTHTHLYLAVSIFSGVLHLFKPPQVTANIFSSHSYLLPPLTFPSTLLFPLYQPLSLAVSLPLFL